MSGQTIAFDDDDIKEEIVEWAALLAQLTSPQEAAEWLESLALDVLDLKDKHGAITLPK